MRLGILLLFIAVVFGGGFWATLIDPVCKTPVQYYIGDIDYRFNTSKDELQRITKNAELIWENRLGENLFIYNEKGDLPVNLVFDERQRNSEIEEELRENLETKESVSDGVAQQYQDLISQFDVLKKNYESRVIIYESELQEYNTVVAEWNKKGGAPKNKISELKLEQERLAIEQKELERQSKKLDGIVSKLNMIGTKGNTLITDYNRIVEEYNTRFSESHEYTQGDQSIDAINVYQFNTEEELTLVLAHEMGHAISLDHVENKLSIMHRSMGAQQIATGLTEEDITEFSRICSSKGFLVTLASLLQNIF